MGIHALHKPQRSVDFIGRFHCQWVPFVSIVLSLDHSLVISVSRYRSYRGYSYDAAYTSHAHGWSSGPTSALTFFVLGLQVNTPMGQTWTVDPHLSGLQKAEGGFETPLGWFGVKWNVNTARGVKTLVVNVNVPSGTSGKVVVPKGGKTSGATLDNRSVRVGAERSIAVKGGNHTVSIVIT